ncbi:hypothetical protein FRACYDRAFT_241084 [Fragilariopsis cylindrus CCMP1102]|uniref:MYND-type domain-containing protein n=1 Tax=Fragilariopsis cylindrus CCMP1102 TaxID=635003 RepID=A0A1E7F8P7_9STRA|nr:hypothetical protein FRACYDRAFT_241084 [Fragilariopsis cylindrus CCMP1102]|eukprot:OEU14537.1 hypothetical protein FRACYDRAFT_241084 [Fragilariopsis cylindrus CCMP1102]
MTNKKRNRKNKKKDASSSSSSSSSATAAISTTATARANRRIMDGERKPLKIYVDKEFPDSTYVVRGERFLGRGQTSTAFDVFKEGTESGCVASLCYYAVLMAGAHTADLHLSLPWALEGALRGHCGCISLLKNDIYKIFYQVTTLDPPIALWAYWAKTHDSLLNKRETRKTIKEVRVLLAGRCYICKTIDSEEDVTLRKCDDCKMYHYCSVECQLTHWKEGEHRNECKHLQILNKYHKPYAKRIREATIHGDKQIPALERLRNRLGLTRKKEEYQHLLVPMKDLPRNAINGSPNRPDDYCIARNDGTVHIGSTPAVI